MLVASNLKNNIGRLVNGNSLELVCLRRNLSVSASRAAKDNYKLLIVGGGSGGVTMSAKFAKILGPQNVAIVEPNEWHCNYYHILSYRTPYWIMFIRYYCYYLDFLDLRSFLQSYFRAYHFFLLAFYISDISL